MGRFESRSEEGRVCTGGGVCALAPGSHIDMGTGRSSEKKPLQRDFKPGVPRS